MKILVVTHYFPPEIGAPQRRLGDLARLWSAAGEQVTVLTGMPNHPTGRVPAQYRKKVRVVEEYEGSRIIRTWLFATPNEGFLRKTLGHLSFMVSSVLLGVRPAGEQDLVIVSSPTFFSIFSGWLVARIKRASFLIEVRDLWPAIFVELGVIKNRWVIKALEILELAAYNAADRVVVVTEGFRAKLLERGISEAKLHVMPNGVDLDRFLPPPAEVKIRRKLGAGGKDCLVLYIGAHGISHALGTIVEAASLLRGESIHFAFVGEGAAKRMLEAHVIDLGLDNVTLLSAISQEDVPSVVASADVCLVPLRDLPLFRTFIPSKMFEFMGLGKPIIGSISGEAADILRTAGQMVVDPEQPEALANAINELARDPHRRRRMGKDARTFVEAKYNRAKIASEYLDVLRSVT